MLVFIRNASSVSSVSFRASAVSSTASITIPAGAAVGDWAILVDFAVKTAGTPSAVVPAGWTHNTSLGGTSATSRVAVLWKILAAGEPGASITGMDGNASDQKVMLVFSANAAISTGTFASMTTETTNGNAADQTVTAGSGHAPLIVLGLAACNDAIGVFDVETPAFTAKVTQGNLVVGYIIYNASQANHSVGMADLGTGNALSSCYVEIY